jgi:hypothetical protein
LFRSWFLSSVCLDRISASLNNRPVAAAARYAQASSHKSTQQGGAQ